MIRWAAGGAVLIGLAVGQLPLVLLGLVLGGLTLVSTASAWAATQVTLEVELRPGQVEVGQEARLHVVVTNPTPLPLPAVIVELEVPRTLVVRGARGRRTVSVDRRIVSLPIGVRGRERVERTYVAVPAVRGRHSVGPGSVEGGDLFGLDDARGQRPVEATLLAVPRPATLGRSPMARRRLIAGAPRPFALHEQADRVRGTRPYRPGDRLRDVVATTHVPFEP